MVLKRIRQSTICGSICSRLSGSLLTNVQRSFLWTLATFSLFVADYFQRNICCLLNHWPMNHSSNKRHVTPQKKKTKNRRPELPWPSDNFCPCIGMTAHPAWAYYWCLLGAGRSKAGELYRTVVMQVTTWRHYCSMFKCKTMFVAFSVRKKTTACFKRCCWLDFVEILFFTHNLPDYWYIINNTYCEFLNSS